MKSLRILFFMGFMSLGVQGFAQTSCEGLFRAARPAAPFSEDRPWGLQLFERELAKLREAFEKLEGLSDDQKVDELIKIDLRQSFFRLQNLSKMYQGLEKERFSSLKDDFKAVEDAFGQSSLRKTLKKTAIEIGEPELANFFRDEGGHARQDLKAVLGRLGFLSSPAQATSSLLRRAGHESTWPSAKKDRAYLADALAHSAKKLAEDVEAKKFDSDDIEVGLHDFRRRIRSIVLNFIALDGTVVLDYSRKSDPAIEAWFLELKKLNPAILESKYIAVGKPEVLDPLVLPGKEIAILADLARSIGDTKDQAEAQIEIMAALRKMGTGEARLKEVEAKLEKHLKVPKIDHRALANAYQNKFLETKILDRIKHSMRDEEEAP